MAPCLLVSMVMNSAYRNGHVSVILAATTMAVTIAVFTLVLASTASAGDGTSLSRTLPLVRTDGTFVGNSQTKSLPKGTVTLTIKNGKQSFAVDAYNLPGPYDNGLAVFWGDAPQITNAALQYVSVLSQVGSNNHWRLRFESQGAAPEQLNVADLTDLVGMTVFVATETNNAVLRANVTDLLPNPSVLSYRRRVPMYLPDVPLSLNAKGTIHVRYNARTGASVVEVRTRNLNAENRYLQNNALSNCVARGQIAINGRARWKSDTGRGDELFTVDADNGIYASDIGYTTVWDEIGDPEIVRDCFGGVHLWGIIPGPK